MNGPCLKRHYHISIVEPDFVFLITETRQFVLRGLAYRHVVPLLTGRHTPDELAKMLAPHVGAVEVYYALERLAAKGHLTNSAASDSAFWDALNCPPPTLGAQVHALGAIGVEGMEEALTAAGLVTGDTLDVILVDDYLQPTLRDWNAQAKRPWMLVKPGGMIGWIGPIFVPDRTACWECLARRIRINREVEQFILKQAGTEKPLPKSRAALPSTLSAVFNLAATLAARWLAGDHMVLEGKLLTLDLAHPEIRHHPAPRLPHCPTCGEARATDPAPIVLQPSIARYSEDGGQRVVSADETYEKYRHLVSPISGVVHRLESRIEDGTAFVYFAGHNVARSYDQYPGLYRNLRSKSLGKGKTASQARTSGLCEAVERYCGLFWGTEPRRRATLAALGEEAIHPHHCLLYSERQYRGHRHASHPSERVPHPFDESAAVEWSPVWSFTQKRFRLLPTALCYMRYPPTPEAAFCFSDSNGNAAGNTLEEAILQGFFELVERDAVALWWYNRLRRAAVDLAIFNDAWLQSLPAYFAGLGRELWVLDITSDLGIPTCAAISRRTRGAEEILLGFGCHHDAHLAVVRAITEHNQSLPQALENEFVDPMMATWTENATVVNQPYLAPLGEPSRTFPPPWSNDMMACVLNAQRLVEERGLEMLVLDQTRADVGLPVVKVIVPGLRHFWARFAPGRLYDVPVREGWLAHPTAEEDLNPIAMFL